MIEAAGDIIAMAAFWAVPALLLAALVRWSLKKEKKPSEWAFVCYNLLVAVAVIVLLFCLPNDWNPSGFGMLCTLGCIFIVFWTVSVLTTKKLHISFFWALLWSVGTIIAGVIIDIMVHGIGPC
jgi:hypothetical protein